MNEGLGQRAGGRASERGRVATLRPAGYILLLSGIPTILRRRVRVGANCATRIAKRRLAEIQSVSVSLSLRDSQPGQYTATPVLQPNITPWAPR